MAYAAALGASRYLDWPDDGGPAVHPAYLVSLEWPAVTESAPLFGLDEREQYQALHLAHESHWLQPLRAGVVLSTSASVESIEQCSSGGVLVLRLDTVDDAGHVVAVTRQTMLYRDVAVDGEDTAPPSPRPAAAAQVLEPAETIEVDAALPYVYTECSGIAFAIHTDPRAARRAGLPGVILHGTATMALALTRILDRYADGDPARLRSVALGFGAVVPVPTTLSLGLPPAGNVETGEVPFEVVLPDGSRAIRGGVVTLGAPA
jgi:acyl dehydratase